MKRLRTLSVIVIANTAYRIYKAARTIAKKGIKGNQYDQYASHFPPGYRPYVKDILRGTDIAFSGGLISEAIHFGFDAIPKKSPTTSGKDRKNGDYMDRPGSGFRSRKYKQNYCYPRNKQFRNR